MDLTCRASLGLGSYLCRSLNPKSTMDCVNICLETTNLLRTRKGGRKVMPVLVRRSVYLNFINHT